MKKVLLMMVMGFISAAMSPVSLLSAPIYFPEAESREGLLSLQAGILSLNAELETEFLASEGDEDLPFNNGNQSVFHTNQPIQRFRVDKLTLIPQLNINDTIRFYAELEAYTDRTETERAFFREGHLSFFLPYHFFLKMGLDDRFISPEFMADNGAVSENKRLTEVYPLNGTAFWKDEDLGITAGGNHPLGDKGLCYWRVALTNGLYLAHDEITRNQIYPILHDDRDIQNIHVDVSANKELGVGVGIKNTFSQTDHLNLFGFFLASHLAARDLDFLNDVIRGYNSRQSSNSLVGFNAEANLHSLNVFSQYIYSRDGRVSRHGYYIQPSVLFSTQKRKFFNGVRFLYRFNHLDVDVKEIPATLPTSPFTWNRSTHSLAMNIQIHESVLFRNEYHFNGESIGGRHSSVSNDEFLSQLEMRF